MTDILLTIERMFPGFKTLTLEQKYRVVLNCMALKEIDREQAVLACLQLVNEKADHATP